MVGSVRGGRFRTDSDDSRPGPSDSGEVVGLWPNGRYHTSSAPAARDSPTSSPSWGSGEEVSVPSAMSGAARSRRTISASSAASSTTVTEAAAGPASERLSQESAEKES